MAGPGAGVPASQAPLTGPAAGRVYAVVVLQDVYGLDGDVSWAAISCLLCCFLEGIHKCCLNAINPPLRKGILHALPAHGCTSVLAAQALSTYMSAPGGVCLHLQCHTHDCGVSALCTTLMLAASLRDASRTFTPLKQLVGRVAYRCPAHAGAALSSSMSYSRIHISTQ